MNIFKTIKTKIQSLVCKSNTLNTELRELSRTISNLPDEIQNTAFEVVEGITIYDNDSEISYYVDGNLYLKLSEVWNKSLIPVLKIRYADFGKYSTIYLRCSKQRWNPKWLRSSKTPEEVYITESFINTAFFDSRLVIQQSTNDIIFLTGSFYSIETTINKSADDCSFADDSSDS